MIFAAKSSFMSHLWLWWLAMLGAIILMPWLMSPQQLQIAPKEVSTAQSLGDNLPTVKNRADATFETWCVRTGIVGATRAIAEKSMNVVIVNPQRYWVGFWSLVYRAIWRFKAFAWDYLAALIAIVAPTTFDGVMTRMRKRYMFGYQNPAYFHGATHLAIFFIGLSVFIPFAPFALTEFTLVVSVLSVALALWVASANIQTGGM
jgi:hypothetical protein